MFYFYFIESSPDKTGGKSDDTELHISEENWEDELGSGLSSKENSVEKEVKTLKHINHMILCNCFDKI